jgi:glycosyltransferase involved in cell wall biosynthesis
MRVAMDVSPLAQTRAGTARYVEGLLRHLDVEPLRFGGSGRAAALARDAIWYPSLALRGGVDVLHCPTFRGPPRARVPLVVTVHDLAVLRHPEWFNRWTHGYSRLAVPRVVRAADRVIAVSEATRRDVQELLGVDAVVIPNGVEEVFRPDGPAAEGDYVLAVGTLEPRKNLARIAEACRGLDLRIAGARGWGGIEPPAGATFLGPVADEELARLYRGARCLVYASLYEGYGIPVAEALACGCPVVTSVGSPMAELGDVVTVDPLDVASIRAGIERAARPAHAEPPRWPEVAATTWSVYEAVA